MAQACQRVRNGPGRAGEDRHCFMSIFRGSIARGMRPRRWARTSSWMMEVLFQT